MRIGVIIKFYICVDIELIFKLYVYQILKSSFTSYFSIKGLVTMMKFDDKKFLAQKIKYYRKKNHLTQAELAEEVDLSVQHISRIENGCYIPSLTSFFMIVSVLKIDLREFGFNKETTTHPLKNKLIEIVSNATDAELIFYENVMNAVNNSLSKVKKELL